MSTTRTRQTITKLAEEVPRAAERMEISITENDGGETGSRLDQNVLDTIERAVRGAWWKA